MGQLKESLLTNDLDDVKIQTPCQGVHGNSGSTTVVIKKRKQDDRTVNISVVGSNSSSDHINDTQQPSLPRTILRKRGFNSSVLTYLGKGHRHK